MTRLPQPESDCSPAELVRIEAAALEQLALRLEGSQHEAFEQVAAVLVAAAKNSYRVTLTGIGKSGLIARKIAATLLSTGTAAQFLHPTEALHGDLGLLNSGDVLIALSYSGESEEILRLLPVLPKLGVTLVSFTGRLDSNLAKASAHVLDVSVDREACNYQLAPTASTTTMLALGDALAIAVSHRIDFQPKDFFELHPGGQLGRHLTPVRQLMHLGEDVPIVAPTATLPEIINEMSTKRLGLTTVQSAGKLLGIFSDGDLRRLFASNGADAFHKSAAEILNSSPRTIAPSSFVGDALALMERHKITALVVTADGTAASPVVGVLHLHDVLG